MVIRTGAFKVAPESSFRVLAKPREKAWPLEDWKHIGEPLQSVISEKPAEHGFSLNVPNESLI